VEAKHHDNHLKAPHGAGRGNAAQDTNKKMHLKYPTGEQAVMLDEFGCGFC
jgi:hypothetical protein